MFSKAKYVDSSRRAVRAARAWLVDPTPETYRDAEQAAQSFELEPKQFPPGQEPAFYRTLKACSGAIRCVSDPRHPDPELQAQLDALAARLKRPAGSFLAGSYPRAREDALAGALQAFQEVAGQSPEEAAASVAAAIRREVAPWLRGERDPLADPSEPLPPDEERRLRQLWEHAAAQPADRARLTELVNACRAFGWRYEGRTLDEWQADLRGGINESWYAADRLAEMGLPAVPGAVYALNAKCGPRQREHALQVLARLGPQAIAGLPDVLRLLDDSWQRGAAIRTICSFGPAAEEAVPKLVELLDSEHWPGILNLLGDLGPAAVPQLLRSLAGHPSHATIAGRSLARMGAEPEAVRARMIELIRDDRDNPLGMNVGSAAEVLGLLGASDQGEVALLEGLLSAPGSSARQGAARGLGHLGSRASLPKLEALAQNDSEYYVREAAKEAIAALQRS